MSRVHIPPPVIAAALAAGQRLVAPRGRSRPGDLVAAGVIAAASIGLAASAVATFVRRRTTISPMDAAEPAQLVTSGPNAISRNPMYVGLAGLLTAHAVALRSVPALAAVPVFVFAMDRLQIAGEERALAERFGSDYAAYRARVPRWIGPRGQS